MHSRGAYSHLAQLELFATEVEYLALLQQPTWTAGQVDERTAAAVKPIEEHPP